jgi:Transglycosylase SLT domain
MAGRTLASAWVSVGPSGFADFGKSARDGINRAMKGFSATVPVDADTKPATGSIDDLKGKLADLSRNVSTARLDADDKDAVAKLAAMNVQLDRIGKRLESPRITLEGTAAVEAQLLAVDASFDRLKSKSEDLGPSVAGAGEALGGLASPMGALIGAGVALSPVLITVGTGLAGLAAAATRTIAPILASKDGIAGLDPAQQAAYKSLGALKDQFGGFAKSLEPETLGLFNGGLKLASALMAGVGPVAKATGTALGGMLSVIDAEFKSQTWQDFFGFMAASAGPDVQLLSNALLPLLDTLPKLLTDIQPIAVQLLQTAAGAARLADAAVTLNQKIDQLGAKADSSGGLLGHLSTAAKNAVGQLLPGIPAAQALGKALGLVGDNSDKASTSAGKTATVFQGAWPKAQTYAQWVQQAATATMNLMTAQGKALDTQLAYGNSLVTSANDAASLKTALAASGNQIGLHTQAQRNSFAAANTYISDLSQQAAAAVSSGHGTDAAIKAIQDGLPTLDSAKSKNQQYWQEVQTLVGWLKQLQLNAFENVSIHVTGAGSWSVTGNTITPGVAHGPQNIGGAPTSSGAAAGLYVASGTGPTADDVLIRASRGELIVPAGMVASGAVDHLRGSIPGFAAGGVAGSFSSGNVAALAPWSSGMIDDTTTAIAQNTAQAILNAMSAAQAQAQAAMTSVNVPDVGGGVSRWLPIVLQALALNGEPATLANQVLYQISTESGGSPNAQNNSDSNAAAGDPSRGLLQTIGSTFSAYHIPGTSNNIFDPLANVAAAINYAKHVYGPSLMSGGMGLGSGHGYAAGGLVGYAAGGVVGAWTKKLAGLQAHEKRDYAGLVKAFGPHPSGGAASDLATLRKRQSAEQAAYAAAVAVGITGGAGPAGPLVSALKAEAASAKDKALVAGHPGWAHGLGYWLGQLTTAAGREPAAPKLQFATWLAKAKATQAHEAYDYAGLEKAFGPHPKGAIGERLYALALKQKAEAAAYSALAAHATGSVPDLAGLPGRISALGSAARATSGAIQPKLLGKYHPGWTAGLTAQLAALASLTGAAPYAPPWNPGNLGASRTAGGGGVLTFDRGGQWPSGTLGWNGSGRTETVIPGGASGVHVHLHMENNGVIGSQVELRNWFVRTANEASRTGYLTQAVKQALG